MSATNRRDFLKIAGGALAAHPLPAMPAMAQAAPVRIGVLAARSGVLASIGECSLVTVQWWADRVNNPAAYSAERSNSSSRRRAIRRKRSSASASSRCATMWK